MSLGCGFRSEHHLSDYRHVRVLNALSDSKERHITAICLFAECPLQELHVMAEIGLVRFSDVVTGGKRMQITSRGLDFLAHSRGGAAAPHRT
jgi:hypothetical protein